MSFVDKDNLILAVNGLLAEYKIFRCVITGRENVITLKEFRSQLLVEERIVETLIPENSSYLTAMHTTSLKSTASPTTCTHQPHRNHTYNAYDNGNYKSFNRNRGRGRTNQ